MAYDIGPRIGIEGEAEFRQAINALNTSFKTLGTEMAAVTSQFDKNDKSSKSLTAQNGVLNKQIDLQKEKLTQLNSGLAQSTTKYGEADKVTQGWQQAVNKATAELNKMDRALAENNKNIALQDSNWTKIGKSFDTIGTKMKTVGEGFSGAGEKLSKGLTVPIIAAGAGLFALVVKSTDAADELQKMSDTTGLNVGRLQELQYIGTKVDVELTTMTDSQKFLTKAMSAAQAGTKAQSEIFKTLGVSVVDSSGHLRDSNVVFNEAITALGKMTNPTERNAMALKLFGKSALELNPLITAGAGEIAKLTAEAHKNGAVMSEESVLAMHKFSDSMSALKLSISDATGKIVAEMVPTLNELIPIVQNQIIPAIGAFAQKIADLIISFANLSPTTQKIILGFGVFAVAIGPLLSLIGSITTVAGAIAEAFGAASIAIADAGGIIAVVVATITSPITITIAAIAALAAIAFVVVKNWEPIKAFFSNLWTSITTTTTAAWEGIKQFFGQIPGAVSTFLGAAIAKITEFGSNIITWVAIEIPLFVNNFMTFMGELPGKIGYALGFAMGTIVKFGIDAVNWVMTEVPKIINNIVTFFSELPGKIGALLTGVLNTITGWGNSEASWVAVKVPQITGSIVSFFAQLPGEIANTLSGALTSLINWVSSMVSMVAARVPGIVSSIVSFFSGLPSSMANVGSNIVGGLWNGISNMVGWLGSKVRDFASGILRGMKDALGIKSPSTVMRDEVGAMVGAGMVEGIDRSINGVKAAMSRMSKSLVAEATISTNINAPATTQGYEVYNPPQGSNIYSHEASQDMALKTAQEVARGMLEANKGGGGLYVTIKNFINNREQDVQAFAEEMEFYRKQVATGKGGS